MRRIAGFPTGKGIAIIVVAPMLNPDRDGVGLIVPSVVCSLCSFSALVNEMWKVGIS